MEKDNHSFKGITLLITHYNRSGSLKNLLVSFQKLHCSFEEIVVSDDASNPEHLKEVKLLQEAFSFRLITSPKNGGLGHNINKGQDAVKTPYTLYIQEDFEPQEAFPDQLKYSLNVMDKRKDLDIIRYYSYLKYPYLKPYDRGFSEMYIFPFARNYKKIYFYSDHPHLRRSSFLNKFGRYREGVNVDKCEYSMCISFIRNKGKGLFYNDFQSLFKQKNTSDEPSTMRRSKWTESNHPFIFYTREIYRQIKYNFNLLV